MITTAIPIHDAKTNLSKYIAAAKDGERVYIGSYGKPEVAIVRLSELKEPKKRDFSVFKGMAIDYGNGFTPETDKEIADLMLGGDML